MASQISDRQFERSFESVFDSLTFLARRLTSCEFDTAIDLVCEARHVAYRILDRFDASSGPAGFRHWTSRILSLHCQSYRRRAAREPQTVPLEEANRVAAPPVCSDEALELINTLDSLPPKLRECVDLHLDGMAQAAIARALGIHRNTVSNRLESAEQWLGARLPGFAPDVDATLLNQCSEHATYYPPSGVWDNASTARERERRRRRIRVTNGFTEDHDSVIWYDRAGLSVSEEYRVARAAMEAAQAARAARIKRAKVKGPVKQCKKRRR